MNATVKKAMLLVNLLAFTAIVPLYAQINTASVSPTYASGEVLVSFSNRYAASSTETANALNAVLGKNQYTQETFNHLSSAVIRSNTYTTPELLEKFASINSVRAVAPNYINRFANDRNDTYYNDLWALQNTGQAAGTPDADIDADEAWKLEEGSRDVVVAVIDSGIDYTHEDLRENMWDGTAFGLKYHGYDFASDAAGGNDDDPMPVLPHGTHIAGTLGAVANNIGVVGVAPKVSLMALKVFRDDGNAFDSDILEALNFVSQKVDAGVNIVAVNASYTSTGRSDVIRNVIEELGNKGVLFCAAAGNDTSDNDRIARYPAGYNLDNIISVTATDRNDRLAYFSNYGTTSVDIAAPGLNIVSTVPHNSYDISSGTSMAVPLVAGSIALLAAYDANSTATQRKRSLLNSVDSLASLQNKVSSGGRLNVHRALLNLKKSADVTTWATGVYGNFEDRRQLLSIPGAKSLRVTITGETEPFYDFIYIYDEAGNQLMQLDGSINKSIIVKGSSVTARLVSDNSQSASGVTVRIEAVEHTADTKNITSWSTGPFSSNEKRSKNLFIHGAKKLEVTVSGSTEAGHDYLYLYDQNGTQLARLDGDINTTITVEGASVTARLTSDVSVTSTGVTISIKAIAGKGDVTAWSTGTYQNDEDRSQKLSISGATRLKVVVTGETELYYDHFFIYDGHNNPVAQLNGIINKTFIVQGDSIRARILSDHYDTASGVTVSISSL